MSLRILLVDDHEVVRVGLRTLIERHATLQVVGEAGAAREAIEQVGRLQPDVVVLDIRLPGSSGVDACREIKERWPEVRVIILTSFPDDDVLFDAIAAGADGYVLKQVGSDELITALQRVGRGESLLDPSMIQKVFDKIRSARKKERAEAFKSLTTQEMQILGHIAEGLTNSEIGERLHLSEKTVRNYVSEVLRKLDLTSRAQAAAFAARHHIEEYL
jgi:two-component system, NarL family, response regulator DevR